MNRRFKVKVSEISIGEYGAHRVRELTLQLRVPYKSIFGKIKYTYVNVLSVYENDIPKYCVTEEQINNYLVNRFTRIRCATKRDRVINRLYLKNLK